VNVAGSSVVNANESRGVAEATVAPSAGVGATNVSVGAVLST
jgi:hypothetical protein